MSAGLDIASTANAIPVRPVPTASPQLFNLSAAGRPEGRPVVLSPQQLRLHRALGELGWIGAIDELNDARFMRSSVAEPILVTTEGTILSGFGRWRSALFDGRLEINCIEYLLNEDESLQFILTHHQTRGGWNAFVRIRVALTLEPSLQERALANMSEGGKFKGLANLPEAQHIDVRRQIANIAGSCPRNVSSVKSILKVAHPQLIEALQNGTLRISRASQFCKVPHTEQLKQFIRYSEDRATNKVIRGSISQPKEKKASLDAVAVLDALQRQEARQSGSIAVRVGRHKRTVILIGEDLSAVLRAQREFKLQ